MNSTRIPFAGALLVFGLASRGGAAAGDASPPPVLVSAATGVSAVLERIGKAFTEKTGAPVQVSSGGSAALSDKIVKGAPADLLVSAGPGPIALLIQYGLADEGSAFAWATNRLVVVTSAEHALSLSSLDELASAGVHHLVIGNPASAVAGSYAQRALMTLGLWAKLKEKVILAPDIPSALDDVESGKADFGIVYASDARLASRIKVVMTIPERTHDPIQYPAARVAHSGASPAAAPFIDFLRGPEAKRILEDAGFTPSFP